MKRWILTGSIDSEALAGVISDEITLLNALRSEILRKYRAIEFLQFQIQKLYNLVGEIEREDAHRWLLESQRQVELPKRNEHPKPAPKKKFSRFDVPRLSSEKVAEFQGKILFCTRLIIPAWNWR